jgi:hypothetical protein
LWVPQLQHEHTRQGRAVFGGAIVAVCALSEPRAPHLRQCCAEKRSMDFFSVAAPAAHRTKANPMQWMAKKSPWSFL